MAKAGATDLLHTAPCGFLAVADDGRILYANVTLLGLVEADALSGQHVDAILTPGARIFYQTHVFPLLKLRNRVEEVYLSLRTRSGDDVPVLLNAVRGIRDGHPVNDAVVVPMRRRNQFESELLQAKHVAEEANRARARFLSILSHDLRAPLSAINMAATILQSGAVGPVNEIQSHDLRRIEDASSYVLRLVTDLLNFARMEAGRIDVRLRPIALSDVLDRTLGVVEPLASGAGLTYDADLHDPACEILADPERLQQVLLNLLTNAVKFTDGGGRITLASERVGSTVRLHVRDTGHGIPPDAIDRIFDPFVQLDRPDASGPREGAGLGLAISRELTHAMKGELTVASVLGAGTSFTVALPLVSPEG
ncbi:MAG: HAMP domain-containing sensor histidine kinase [Rhodothermales bacterium]